MSNAFVWDIDTPQNRRINTRVRFHEPVHYQVLQPGKEGGTLSLDISEGGLRVNFNDFLPLGSKITFKIPLTPKKMLDCLGKIVWIQKLAFNDNYQAGIVFEGPTEYTSETIRKWLQFNQLT